MKILCVLCVVVMSVLSLQAQSSQSSQAATHFYIVNVDEDLMDVFLSANADKNSSHVDLSAGNEFVASIIDTFYFIISEKFRNELGLELLPLGELQGKVRYNTLFPNCPDMANIKKVIKNAAGYKYYMDYYVNIYSDIPESPVKPSPSKIRPLYAISFTIYDSNGNQVKKVEVTYKSGKPLVENKQEMNKLVSILKLKLCDHYAEALKLLTLEFKRKMTAQL